ncbi:twin-arginine translocase TatA/TatE family subunit [Methanosarcina sp. KYL-1]|nr:twin-arginine translocase TatA/TatE family subunit [Methanosarcina sp. KYL-1]MCQ1536437.1 twin-arginine translocase TatA/TatE family subunit [Methanosarcina sp. KYL-1]
MIGSTELIAILIAALFLFGPQKLPELARSLGSAVGEFKKAQRAAELELTDFDAYTRRPGQDADPEERGEDAKKKEKESRSKGSINRETKANSGLGSVLESKSSLPEQQEPEPAKPTEKV